MGLFMNKLRRDIVLTVVSIFAFTALFLSLEYRELYTESSLRLLCAASSALSIWTIFVIYRYVGTPLHPIFLFSVSNFLFGSGQILLEALSLNQMGLLGGKFPLPTCNLTVYLLTLGAASLQVGFLGARSLAERYFHRGGDRAIGDNSIVIVGWLMLAVAAPSFASSALEAVRVVLTSGTIGLYQQEVRYGIDNSAAYLASILVPGCIFILMGSRRQSLAVMFSLFIVVFQSAVYYFVGVRSTATMPLFAYLWAYERAVRKLPKALVLVASLVLLFVVFPVVGVIRGETGANRTSYLDFYFQVDNPAISILTEMGGTLQAVAYTIELVPSTREYDMGVGYLYALLAILPNLFGGQHPSAARAFCYWLVWTVEPQTAANGGGLGFSYIAEAYANFGWVGPAIVPGLIGLAYALFCFWADYSGEPLKIAAVASFTSFVLRLPRDETGTMLRPVVWYVLLPYIACLLLHRMTMRGTRAAPPNRVVMSEPPVPG